MRQITLIAHNLRSTHNVGSLLRTADGLGIEKVYLTGYTPYPTTANDGRLPHLAGKIDRQIHKTALGAEKQVVWQQTDRVEPIIAELRAAQYAICGIEQADNSVLLPDYRPPDKVVLIVGREVEGLEPEVLKLCDFALEIPMYGGKESFNVVQAAAMALYHCRFL